MVSYYPLTFGDTVRKKTTKVQKQIGRGVTFSPIKQSGRNAACQLNEGKFNCSIEPGEYRVEIRSVVAVETEQGPDGPPDTQDGMKELLPACYNDKSKLSVVVVEGSNEEDFVLSSSEK